MAAEDPSSCPTFSQVLPHRSSVVPMQHLILLVSFLVVSPTNLPRDREQIFRILKLKIFSDFLAVSSAVCGIAMRGAGAYPQSDSEHAQTERPASVSRSRRTLYRCSENSSIVTPETQQQQRFSYPSVLAGISRRYPLTFVRWFVLDSHPATLWRWLSGLLLCRSFSYLIKTRKPMRPRANSRSAQGIRRVQDEDEAKETWSKS